MARTRLELQELFETILESDRVYFQPPENYRLSYPCVVYEFSRTSAAHADNLAYKQNDEYQVTVMYRDPDSDLPMKFMGIRGIRMDRTFRADNVYNTVFNLAIL